MLSHRPRHSSACPHLPVFPSTRLQSADLLGYRLCANPNFAARDNHRLSAFQANRPRSVRQFLLAARGLSRQTPLRPPLRRSVIFGLAFCRIYPTGCLPVSPSFHLSALSALSAPSARPFVRASAHLSPRQPIRLSVYPSSLSAHPHLPSYPSSRSGLPVPVFPSARLPSADLLGYRLCANPNFAARDNRRLSAFQANRPRSVRQLSLAARGLSRQTPLRPPLRRSVIFGLAFWDRISDGNTEMAIPRWQYRDVILRLYYLDLIIGVAFRGRRSGAKRSGEGFRNDIDVSAFWRLLFP